MPVMVPLIGTARISRGLFCACPDYLLAVAYPFMAFAKWMCSKAFRSESFGAAS